MKRTSKPRDWQIRSQPTTIASGISSSSSLSSVSALCFEGFEQGALQFSLFLPLTSPYRTRLLEPSGSRSPPSSRVARFNFAFRDERFCCIFFRFRERFLDGMGVDTGVQGVDSLVGGEVNVISMGVTCRVTPGDNILMRGYRQLQ
jgi:hypothetical protein